MPEGEGESGGRQPREQLERAFGSVPWLKAKEVKRFRVKVFKSGNSLALRLPAGLGLQAGAEMNLEVENAEFFSFTPVERPKRKFDVGRIWGIAPGLELVRPEDRVFDDRHRLRDDPDWTGTDRPAT